MAWENDGGTSQIVARIKMPANAGNVALMPHTTTTLIYLR